jgi:hypothetical protein
MRALLILLATILLTSCEEEIYTAEPIAPTPVEEAIIYPKEVVPPVFKSTILSESPGKIVKTGIFLQMPYSEIEGTYTIVRRIYTVASGKMDIRVVYLVGNTNYFFEESKCITTIITTADLVSYRVENENGNAFTTLKRTGKTYYEVYTNNNSNLPEKVYNIHNPI